jgi:catechol 2,3-dioxygenase-like lactoylglutathione lyase family enzyme
MNKKSFESTRDVFMQIPDMTQARKFYTEIMNFKPTHDNESIAGFDTGGFELFTEAGNLPGQVFELLVADLNAAKYKLLASECSIIEDNPRAPRSYMRDPFGLTFNLGPH